MKSLNSNSAILRVINLTLKNKLSRNMLLPSLDRTVRDRVLRDISPQSPKNVRMYHYYGLRAMYMSFFKNYDKGYISPEVTDKVIRTLVEEVFLGKKEQKESKENFKNKYGQDSTTFITISPTKKCNLNCTGCYASSNATCTASLDWTLLDKIIEDLYNNMGMRFFVISGGEPLLYKSENKTILDLAHKWNDCFFLMYTNGTLINDDIASQMASAGNITPAISVEGFETETDKRRGEGVFRKIINAKNSLIKNGVPFGLSVTATKENIGLMLDDSFYEYYFDNFGATYMWVFQYMPIGREFSTDLMITPVQRVELFKQEMKILIDKKHFIADFWNSAILSNGCISCGKPHGYFYINWDGNIMPCVFVPHYLDNVKSLYSSGKKLSDALFSPLFVKGREWQSDYLENNGKPANLLTPCFYRDHYKNFAEIAKSTGAKPENQAAEDALQSTEYYEAMLSFDDQLKKIASPVWDEILKTN